MIRTRPGLFAVSLSFLLPGATLLALLTAPCPLLAQAKDIGPAQKYYKQQPSRFKFVAPTVKKGGDAQFSVSEKGGGRMEMVRDEYVILEKEVKITYQDVKIQADKATYNLKTKDAVAEGHVIVDQGPTRLTADRVFFNLNTKTGTFFHATGSMQPELYFTGEKLEKLGEATYRLTDGIFTSCDLDKPSWSFHVKVADITLDDYAHMQNVSFRAHEIPLVFTPRLVWPTKKDRSQGVLIPRLMFHSEFGDRLELGYFVPFGDSADATVYADVNTKGYNGGGVNIRYRPSENVKLGDLNAYTVHDVKAARAQWRYSYQHSQENLPGGFRGVVDMEDFSNIEFFRRFDRDPRLQTLSQIYSSAYLTKNRQTYSFNILTDRRDLFGGVPTDAKQAPPRQRFEQLPSLQLRTYPNRLGNSPLYFSLESSLSHLVTKGLINGPTANYYRADFFPTLSLQIPGPPWFSIRPEISVRDTQYTASLKPGQTGSTTGLESVDTGIRRSYAQGQVEVVGPSFSRIFNNSIGGFSRFKHVIEPRFRYLYTTNVSNKDRVLRFDTVDTPFLPTVRNSVEYSLTQRLIGREAGESASAREVASFSLRQSVSIGQPFTTTTGGNLPGSTVTPAQGMGKFTPLVASLHVNPYQSVTFDANTTFGNVSRQIEQASVSANLLGTGERADKYLSFTYFASFKTPQQQFDSSASQIRLNTGTSLLRDRLRGDVQLNFDAKNGKFLEQRYLIGGTASCYGVALELRRFLVYFPKERPDWSAGVAITLKNVGTIGTH